MADFDRKSHNLRHHYGMKSMPGRDLASASQEGIKCDQLSYSRTPSDSSEKCGHITLKNQVPKTPKKRENVCRSMLNGKRQRGAGVTLKAISQNGHEVSFKIEAAS